MSDKVLSMLGLSRRAGKLQTGFEASVSAAREKKAYLLLAAGDISEKTCKNLFYEGSRAGIKTVRLNETMLETGKACGTKSGVYAVTDEQLSKAVLKAIEQNEKEEQTI